jgi:hypothetical protein
MRVTPLLAALGLAMVAFALVPEVTATQQIPGLDCSYVYSWDSDGDGNAESWRYCATAQCGCMCPYTGIAVELAADGTDHETAVVLGCQSAVGTAAEPSDADPTPHVTTWGGGGPAAE